MKNKSFDLRYRIPGDYKLSYLMKNQTLEALADLATGVLKGKTFVDHHYQQKVSVSVFKDTSSSNGLLRVLFDVQEEGSVIYALQDFFERAEVLPDFVSGGYSYVDKVLQQYGKTLKRKFNGCMDGKHVVDIKR